jgi:hypothetical protein
MDLDQFTGILAEQAETRHVSRPETGVLEPLILVVARSERRGPRDSVGLGCHDPAAGTVVSPSRISQRYPFT